MDRTGNLVGASAHILSTARNADDAPSLASFGSCLNAKASIVEKQLGADPNLPGPGQYIDPIKEGRNENGEVKAVLSGQRSTKSVVFGPKPTGSAIGRDLVRPGAAEEPGPGQYIDPLKEGRAENGEVHAVLSTQKNLNRVVFGKHKIRRDLARPGAEHEPGPGAYVNPLTEGRNARGEVKAVLSHQMTTTSAVFGIPGGPVESRNRTKIRAKMRKAVDEPGPGAYINPLTVDRGPNGEMRPVLSSETAYPVIRFTKGGAFSRSLAKPGAEHEPGPGAYINPLKEGRKETGEVKAILSSQKSTPSAVFGKGAARPVMSRYDKGPGPAKYKIPTTLGTQALSNFKTVPTARWGPPGR